MHAKERPRSGQHRLDQFTDTVLAYARDKIFGFCISPGGAHFTFSARTNVTAFSLVLSSKILPFATTVIDECPPPATTLNNSNRRYSFEILP